MTTHARHGLRRAVLGSVAENVLRESPVPVLLLPGPAEDRDFRAFRHMLLAVDGSALSQALIEPTAELALKLGAAVTLVRSYAPPKAPTVDEHGTMIRSIDQEVDRILLLGEQFMAPLVRRLKDLGVEAAGQIAINGHPAQGILSVGHEVQADLIVMATHGRSGLDRMRHGSVTEEVLRHSDLPLLAFGRVALHVLVKEPVAEATVAEPIRVSAPEVAF